MRKNGIKMTNLHYDGQILQHWHLKSNNDLDKTTVLLYITNTYSKTKSEVQMVQPET